MGLFNMKRPQIVEVKVLDRYIEEKTGGVAGGILGGLIAGPLGSVIGATATTSSKQVQRFAVRYDDGTKIISEAYIGGERYKKLMSYVDWEDLQ